MERLDGKSRLDKPLFIERLQNTKVGNQIQTLMGFAWGHNYKFFAGVLIDVFLIWAALIAVFWLVSYIAPLPGCFSNCRAISKQGCCYLAWAVLVRGVLGALIVFALSRKFTFSAKEYCFLRSGLTSAFFMVSLAVVSLWQGFSLSAVVVATLPVLLAMFFGYRLGMRQKSNL